MGFSISPDVEFKEVDATATTPPTSSTTAAIAGVFHWGPVNERVLVTSEAHLVSRFGKPSSFNYETFFTAADFLSYSNALYVVRVADGANTASISDSTFDAKYPGELGNSLQVSAVTGANSFSSAVFAEGAVTANIAFGATSMTFDYNSNIPIKVGDVLKLGNTTIGYQELKVSALTETPINANTSTYAVTTESRYALTAENLSTISMTRKWGFFNAVNAAPKANTFHLVVADEDGKFTGTKGTILEVHENVSTVAGTKLEDGTSNYYKDVILAKSDLIKVGSANVSTASDTVSYLSMTGGLDGNGERTATPVSFATIALGYDLFKKPEVVDVSLIMQGKAFGGANETGVANYIIDNICDVRKDCVVFVSPSYSDCVTPVNDNDKLNAIVAYAGSINSSSYAFIDSGYKYRYDKYNDVYRWTPMNGDTAGLAARVDPWESPAGYKRGNIKNISKLAYNPEKAHRDILYGVSVNSIITQRGRGTVLYGDKTAYDIESSAFSRLNVRRLFITVEQAVSATSKYFLFDLNTEFTQTQFKNMVEPLLRDIQGKGGITSFKVVSDSTINTPDVIDRNEFRANIFIAPARSINYINLTFIATRTGVEFDELVGQQL